MLVEHLEHFIVVLTITGLNQHLKNFLFSLAVKGYSLKINALRLLG